MSSSNSIISYSSSQNSGNCFTYCNQFITKDTSQEQPNGMHILDKVWEKDMEFPSLSGHATLAAPPYVHQPGSSPNTII